MKAWKTQVRTDNGLMVNVDTIEYDGGLWLVPRWLEGPSPAMKKPARLIRMDTLPHQDIGPIPGGLRRFYILQDSLPKAVLDVDCQLPGDTGLDVLEVPNLSLRIDGYDE